MADCECLQGCLFFNDRMPGTGEVAGVYKQLYCTGDNSTCARYMVYRKLGRPSVPDDLYPHMYYRARTILKPE